MSINVSIKLFGDKKFTRKLDKLTKVAQQKDGKKLLRVATREVAKFMARPIKSNMQRKSGQSRRATRVRAMKRSRKRIGSQVVNDEKWYQGDDYYYAFQEFGWNIGKRTASEARQQKGTRRAGRQTGDVLRSATRRFKEGTHRFERAAKSKESAASLRLQTKIAGIVVQVLREK